MTSRPIKQDSLGLMSLELSAAVPIVIIITVLLRQCMLADFPAIVVEVDGEQGEGFLP